MTEQEWLASEDPTAMLAWVMTGSGSGGNPDGQPPAPSDRKVRLFACACCRLVWDKFDDPRSRKAVKVAERLADGLAGHDEVTEARGEARHVGCTQSAPGEHCFSCAAIETLAREIGFRETWFASCFAPAAQAALLRDIVGNPWRPVRRDRACWVLPGGQESRTRTLEPWITPEVLSLAQAAYDERPGRTCAACKDEFVWSKSADTLRKCNACRGTGRVEDGTLDPLRVAILADALEEAGCPAEDRVVLESKCPTCNGVGKIRLMSVPGHAPAVDNCPTCKGARIVRKSYDNGILFHLRSPGPHVRGCWALDAVLGRS